MQYFSFKETIFIKNSLWQQYFHLVSEVFELGIEIFRKNYPAVLRESMDVRCSTETLQRIAQKETVYTVEEAYEAVQHGHLARHYYRSKGE